MSRLLPLLAVAALAVGTASAVEIAWTVIGLTGLYFNYRNLHEVKKDLAAVEKLDGGVLASHRIMKIIAYGHYRNEILRTIISLTITLVGVLADIQAPVLPATPITATSIAVTFGLFIIAGISAVMSALDRQQRHMIRAIAPRAPRTARTRTTD